jgi:acyl carrier protein
MNTMKTLNDIFCSVFDDETIQLRPEMTANDVEGWDSFSHVNLILAIEERYRIRFAQRELLAFKNVGDLIKGIESKTLSRPGN